MITIRRLQSPHWSPRVLEDVKANLAGLKQNEKYCANRDAFVMDDWLTHWVMNSSFGGDRDRDWKKASNVKPS
jgi:hypothetical protein